MAKHRRLADRFAGRAFWNDDLTVIGAGLRFSGELKTPGPVVVAGHVEGPVTAEGLVHVLAGGVVRGPLDGSGVIIDGSVEGDVHATEQVELGLGGRLVGTVTAPRVALAEGGYLKGDVHADPSAVKRFRERRGPRRQ